MMNDFGDRIISWYHINKRDLPWRNTTDPYKIWLSEIILQQTRVEQGMSYYHKFIGKYKNVKALASASEDEVLKLWQGLGYYSRARNLHTAAKDIVSRFNGKFPSDYTDIRSLKGVGEYTAAAIASFAFQLPHAVVDGNVFRLLSRYAGIRTPIDSGAGKREFTELADGLLGDHPPHLFNQAIMEFGSRQCKPVNPDCSVCPLQTSCFAFENDLTKVLPVKSQKTKIRKRYFHYLVIRQRDNFYIRQRKEKDIWTGLYDFPLIETKSEVSKTKMLGSSEWKDWLKDFPQEQVSVSGEFRHVLSHQHIHAWFYEISAGNKSLKKEVNDWKKVDAESVKDYAVPRLIEEYLKNMK